MPFPKPNSTSFSQYHWMNSGPPRHRGTGRGWVFENQISSDDPVQDVGVLLAEFALAQHFARRFCAHVRVVVSSYLRSILHNNQHGSRWGGEKLAIDNVDATQLARGRRFWCAVLVFLTYGIVRDHLLQAWLSSSVSLFLATTSKLNTSGRITSTSISCLRDKKKYKETCF
jgi:hypothetical protein